MQPLKFVFLSLLIISSVNIFAQTFPEIRADAKEFQKRKLIFILQEENADVIKQLEKKGNEEYLASYRKQIEELNKDIEQMAGMFWNMGQDIQFKKISEVEKLNDAKNKEYAIIGFYSLHFSKLINADVKDYSLIWSPVEMNDPNYEANKYDKDYDLSRTNMFAGLIENLYGDKIAATRLCNIYPGKSDLVFSLIYLQSYINEINGNTNDKFVEDVFDGMDTDPGKVKSLTLAVNKDALKDGFTEEEIQKVYPYKFKLFSYDEIAELISSKTPGYACLSACDGSAPFQSFIIDSQSWQILACQDRSSYMSYGGMAINKDLFNRILKDIE